MRRWCDRQYLRVRSAHQHQPAARAREPRGQIFEGVENGDAWAFTSTSITGSSIVLDPSLSNDGLVVVFVGNDGSRRLFVAERPDLASPFQPATPLIDQPGGVGGDEQFPRFGPDCDHIFLSIDSTVVDLR